MENKRSTTIYSNSNFNENEDKASSDTRKHSIYTITEHVENSTEERRPSFPTNARRKSSIFSIIQTDTMIIENKTKPKPCLPITCQKISLSIITVLCIGIIWLSMFSLLGYEAYARIKIQRTANISVLNVVTLPERLLAHANLSNESVHCPPMYIYTARTRSCQPRCGEWGSCGRTVYYVERYVAIGLDTIGIVVGIFAILSWIKNHKEYNLKQFALVICIMMAILPSIFFAALDFPGQKYLFCSNEDKEWDAVRRESKIHINVYAGVITFIFYSFSFWILFTLTNISLSAFFPLSPRLQSRSFYWKLLIIESVVAWGLPLLIIGGFVGSGGRFLLENIIEPPSYSIGSGGYILAVPIYITYRCILTVFILLFHKIRWAVLNKQKYTKATVKMSSLEKRFIALGALYIFLILLRTVYTAWTGFTIRWNLQNRAYAACITLGSPILSPQYNNSMPDYGNETIVSDLLPLRLRDQVPACNYPCIFPIKAILVRMAWLIILSVTMINNFFPNCKRMMKEKTQTTRSTFPGKSTSN